MQISRAILTATHKLLTAREDATKAISLIKTKLLNEELSYTKQQLLAESVLNTEKAEYDAEQAFIETTKSLGLGDFSQDFFKVLKTDFDARKRYVAIILKAIQAEIRQPKQVEYAEL